jgi:hypothetical protein
MRKQICSSRFVLDKQKFRIEMSSLVKSKIDDPEPVVIDVLWGISRD